MNPSLQDTWIQHPADDEHRCPEHIRAGAGYLDEQRCVLEDGHAGAHLAKLSSQLSAGIRVTWPHRDGTCRVRDLPHPDRPRLFPITDAASARRALAYVDQAVDDGQITADEASGIRAIARRRIEEIIAPSTRPGWGNV